MELSGQNLRKTMSLIDEKGYRANVGMILCNDRQQVLWAKRRYPEDSWQFPQGGLVKGESLEEGMYRELNEELGLLPTDVSILAQTKDWLIYDLPEHLIRHHQKPVCIGQKQHWFLLRLLSDDETIYLDNHDEQEFIDWSWVDYDYPMAHVVAFKQKVYEAALQELKPFLG
jgi:putative (di)nucleoside polyphosphate hydrolase